MPTAKLSQFSESAAKTQKKVKSSSKLHTVKFDASSNVATRRINPLVAFSNAPIFSVDDEYSPSQDNLKQKGKAKEKSRRLESEEVRDDRLWVDIHEPTTEAELAVHKKKVEDVRQWLDEAFDGGPSGKLRKYRKILALTGPAGTGKTATLRVLAREMNCQILEWRNTMAESGMNLFNDDSTGPYASTSYSPDHESFISKFEAFLARASACQDIFAPTVASSSNAGLSSQSSRLAPAGMSVRKRQLILIEDLPNILHPNTRSFFHAALQSLVASPSSTPVPIVIIVSDSGIRGEASDERLANGSWGTDRDGVLDIRMVLSKELLGGPYVTQIGFNPIAPTLLRKALQALLSTQFSSSDSKSAPPSKEFLDIVVESANGDIRSAIMALQFACVVELPGGKGRKKNHKGGNARVVLEAVTRREQSLALFHLVGKVLYNKRKGDPPSSSATAKDIQREKDLDSRLKDSPKMPPFLEGHMRRTSRVDVDTLYADSPIDSSLFSLYIHQNYPQFCNDINECDGVADWLSWVDSSGGEAWYQANPHRFHLLTLGTLHSLPSPVVRRSQKVFKPYFFDALNKEKEAWEGVRDVRGWLLDEAIMSNAGRGSGWSRADVAMELGAVLKTRNATKAGSQAPASHRLFSSLMFMYGSNCAGSQALGEGDVDEREEGMAEDDLITRSMDNREPEIDGGGWLASDDIEDY